MRLRSTCPWITILVCLTAWPGWTQLATDRTTSPALARIDCLQAGCHDALNQQAFLHPPSMQGDCTICHVPADTQIDLEAKGHGLKTLPPNLALCSKCHRTLSLDRKVTHEPFRELCTTCHNPHGGTAQYYLTKSPAGDQCLSCHADVVEGLTHLHGPVAMKECLLCHDPHSSNYAGLLARPPDRLCVFCHFNFQKGMDEAQSVHEPMHGNCTGCHTPHGGTAGLLVAESGPDLCAQCHGPTLERMKTAKFPHESMISGKTCTKCHSPHWADFPPLLKQPSMDICLGCHQGPVETTDGRELPAVGPRIESSKFVHGPIQQKDCSPCHAAHGNDDPRLMKAAFPEEFYADYKEGAYALCFQCHDERLVTERETAATGFRNGTYNLHYEHVHREKGRSCRACHHEHASNTRFQIRDSVRFGEWDMELKFKFSDTGGMCLAGCHRPKGYDRVDPVDNEALSQGGVQ